MKLESVQKELNSVSCPVCQTGKLNAILRCDLDPKECVAKAACNTCQSSYHLNGGDSDTGSERTVAICQVDGMQCFLLKAA